MIQPEVVYLPGAGSAGIAFDAVRALVPGRLIPLPDAPTVAAMADILTPELADASAPRVVVAASLGAMVTLELNGRVRMDAWVLMAAGLGIRVHQSLFDLLDNAPDHAPRKLARAGTTPGSAPSILEARTADFEARGVATMRAHFRALADYRPTLPVASPPPAVVVCGMHDRAVPFDDHLQLVVAIGGALVPVDAGHAPFLDQPSLVGSWIHHLVAVAGNAPGIVD